MSGKLKRPKVFSKQLDDYHEHCRNIAQIISKTEDHNAIDIRVLKYFVAVGLTT